MVMKQNMELIELTSDIVSAYVSNNDVESDALPQVIESVHGALSTVSDSKTEKVSLIPAVPIKKSVTPDHIVCLEDGLKFKSLKRHLNAKYNMTPNQYRERWGLPADYPMVAPNYAKARSELAKKMGLGREGKK